MSESVFWGAVVKPGKSSPFVPPPEDAALHISQVVLDPSAKAGARAWLKCKVQDGPEMVVAALREGATEMQSLDLVFDQYTEFSVQGTASVHLTGYLMPEREEGGPEGDDDEDDDEDEGGFGEQMGLPEGMTMEQFKQALQDGRISGMGGDDDDSEDDDDDEDGMGANGFGEDSDEDVETSDYDSEEEEDVRTKSQVLIEEEEPAEPSAVAKAAQQKRKADKQALEPPPAKRAGKQPEAAVAKKASTPAPKAEQKLAAAKTPEAKTPKAVAEAKTPAPVTTGRKNVKRFENGFEIETTAIGQADGKLAKGGKRVQVKYIGRLKSNNKVFDQTKGNKTFAFRLGVGEVIKGWDRGVEGMRVGDKRRLTVPASMGYGSSGAPPSIPPNATLIFDVELCNVL